MSTVTLDILGGSPIARTANGYRVTRTALVEGVTGASAARPYNAINAAGMPAYGSAHPTVPGVFLLEQQVNPVSGSPDKFTVVMTYRIPTAKEAAEFDAGAAFGRAQIEIDTSVTQEQTSADVNGDRMRVVFRGYYLRQGRHLDGSFLHQRTLVAFAWTYPVAEVSRPQLILRVSRWEKNDPEITARELTGSVNVSTWRGYQPSTLLCTAVRANPVPTGGWDVQYEFLWNEADWRFTAGMRIQGYDIPEAEPGNGLTTFDMYPSYELAKLAIRT